LKLAFDWYDVDDKLVIVDPILENKAYSKIENSNESIEEPIFNEETIQDPFVESIDITIDDEYSEIIDSKNSIDKFLKTDSEDKKENIVIPVFRPTQTDYFDLERIELGKIQILQDII